MSVSKPFFTVTQCCCPRGKSLSSRTNLQVLVLVLGLQVLVLVLVLELCCVLDSITGSVLHTRAVFEFSRKSLRSVVTPKGLGECHGCVVQWSKPCTVTVLNYSKTFRHHCIIKFENCSIVDRNLSGIYLCIRAVWSRWVAYFKTQNTHTHTHTHITNTQTALHLCIRLLCCVVQLKAEAEAELKTAQEGCAQVLSVLEGRDGDV